MARGICILLLVVVAAVSTSGYSSYGSYGTKVYNRYPIYKSVVIRHSSHHGYHGFSFYKKYHGFKISHRRFSYHGLGYKLRCGKSRFYRLWRRCYGKYHSRNRCFGVFRKRHLFGTYKGHGYGGGYLRYYKKYHGFRLRHNRFFYGGHGYKLRCSRRRFYRSWRSCYTRYHSRRTCFGYLRKRHLFGIYHTGSSYGGVFGGYNHGKYSYGYYRRHHGFQIRHNRFLYHGTSYQLICSSSRFYRLWSNCYDQYHSVGACFGRLRRQHLFYKYVGGSSYGGVFGGYNYGKYSYGYYRSHHGFQIRHNRFLYHGTSYRLKCSSSRFYRLWSNCYDHYHSVGACFGRLRRQNLFYKYVGGSSYGGVFGGYNHGKYSYGYYRRHHGFQIRHNRFLYHGTSYRLICSSSRFYRLWSNCYDHYHSVGACFGRLRRQHLFYRYGGGSSYGGVFGGYSHGKYSYGYYKSHHGFQISHNRFLYHGVSYQLKCSRSRFYRLWSDCYDNYHSVDACFGRLRRQHLFYTYGGGHYGVGLNYLYKHKKIADYHVNRIHHVANKHVARISHLSNKHERNIAYQAQKHVHRISSVANKHINRFKALVDFHINRLHQHTKHHLSALEYQHKRHLNDREYQNKKHQLNVKYLHVKHEHYINKLHGKYDYGTSYGGGLGHVVSYLDYYKKFHGFKISHNRFSYGGKAYALKCGLQQFYNSWSDCWSSYHRRSICFGRLMKNNLFELYSGDYDVGYAPKTVVVKTVAYGDDSHY